MTTTTKSRRRRNQETGRYEHEWAVVAHQYMLPSAEIYFCGGCSKFQTSNTGNRMFTYEQLRRKFPNAKVDSSDIDFYGLTDAAIAAA